VENIYVANNFSHLPKLIKVSKN